jgi:hypothetical protein
MNAAFKQRSDGMCFIAHNKTHPTNPIGADMLIVFIVLSIFSGLSLATIVEVIKERRQENHMVTSVTARQMKL